MVFLKLAGVIVMAMAIGALYRIPRQLLIPAGLTGGLAWLTYYAAAMLGVNTVAAHFFASLVVGVAAELLARLFRKPATVLVMPGTIALVPGRSAYTAMLHLVNGEYTLGLATGMQTVWIAGAIAFGILLSSTACRLIADYFKEGGRTNARDNSALD